MLIHSERVGTEKDSNRDYALNTIKPIMHYYVLLAEVGSKSLLHGKTTHT